MRKTSQFSIFGNNYRTHQFAAARGVEMLCEGSASANPVALLSGTEVLATEGWLELSGIGAINALVKDSLGLAASLVVLDALCAKVYEENFGFLASWKPVAIPKRFVSTIDFKIEEYKIDPVISTVVMAGQATIRELEEYYSTEDAFKMYDMIAVDSLNKALGSEAAMADAKAHGR